jgi:hypothetical protein
MVSFGNQFCENFEQFCKDFSGITMEDGFFIEGAEGPNFLLGMILIWVII